MNSCWLPAKYLMRNHRVGGFSLVEMAIVIVIITLLLGAVLVPLGAQIAQKNVTETQQTLDQINEALIGFALQKGYLPCPDIDGDGIADSIPPGSPGTCKNGNYRGFLPWVTLNMPKTDAWDDILGYQVSPNFTDTPVNPCVSGNGHLGLCQSGNITIEGRDAKTKTWQPIATTVAAVIISYGKNGYGATSGSGNPRASIPSANKDEITNAIATGGTTFVSRPISAVQNVCSDTAPGLPFCEYDDMLSWISPYTLFNRMVAAGQLP